MRFWLRHGDGVGERAAGRAREIPLSRRAASGADSARQRRKGRAGFTLIELLIVVAILGIILAAAVPAFTAIISSNKSSAARNLIKNALALAQAHAAKTQKYAGIRFQFNRDGPFRGKQYLVLIENVDGTEYNAVANVKPAALPGGIGAISAEVDTFALPPSPLRDQYLDDSDDDLSCLKAATTFCILFSPTGQMVTKRLLVLRRNINDIIFGSEVDVNSNPPPQAPPAPLLYHDQVWGAAADQGPLWCGSEFSTTGLYVFEVAAMKEVEPDYRYTDYVSTLKPILINMYTGAIIED